MRPRPAWEPAWISGSMVNGVVSVKNPQTIATTLLNLHQRIISHQILSPLQYKSCRIFLSNCSHGSFLSKYWTNFDPNSRGFLDWLVLVLYLDSCGWTKKWQKCKAKRVAVSLITEWLVLKRKEYAIRHFITEINGRSLTVFTDHKPTLGSWNK